MNIPIITALIHLVTFYLMYKFFWLIYRYILHPDYRWEQRGNICYDHAFIYAIVWSSLTYCLSFLYYAGYIKITLN